MTYRMADIEQKIDTLYDLLIENFGTLEAELKDLISNPEKIKDTNKFADLISELKNSTFINPLLLVISVSNNNDPWLSDFLYAAINLLDESSIDDEFEIPKSLINKLKVWILENKSELSWKASSLLKFYESELAEEIQLQKLKERGDFFMTYAECLNGLLRYNEEKYIELATEISNDNTRDNKLIEYCEELIKNYR
jgi:hypothetical protein